MPERKLVRYKAYIVILLLILVTMISYVLASARDVTSNYYVLVDLAPIPGNNSWHASITAYVLGEHVNCSGVVEANPYYRETRAVSSKLLAVPIYYVLDSACPKLVTLLELPNPFTSNNTLIRFVIRAPSDYYVFSAMDERGYGSNGSYELPLRLFTKQYIFDGVVIASKKYYRAVYLGKLVLLEPSNNNEDYGVLAETVTCVESFLLNSLGPSSRSPVVLVIASRSDHPYMLTGVGYSLGGVIYVKPLDNDLPSIIHLVAHETVHSWIGKGRIQGGPSLVEGAAELLSLLALYRCNKSLYQEAMIYENESAEANPYAVWLRLHAAIRKATIIACKKDLYIKALRSLYLRGIENANILTLLDTIRDEAATKGCIQRLQYVLGKLLLSAKKYSLEHLLENKQESVADTATAGAGIHEQATSVEVNHCSTATGQELAKHVQPLTRITVTKTMCNETSPLHRLPNHTYSHLNKSTSTRHDLIIVLASLATLFVIAFVYSLSRSRNIF